MNILRNMNATRYGLAMYTSTHADYTGSVNDLKLHLDGVIFSSKTIGVLLSTCIYFSSKFKTLVKNKCHIMIRATDKSKQ